MDEGSTTSFTSAPHTCSNTYAKVHSCLSKTSWTGSVCEIKNITFGIALADESHRPILDLEPSFIRLRGSPPPFINFVINDKLQRKMIYKLPLIGCEQIYWGVFALDSKFYEIGFSEDFMNCSHA